ncbi:dimethylarginine dimethylaminohydrolase family protein [Reichenbachiella versicolor]|uniref:dimethylarginine dimethylaminohydrolase family protein n=1 Tax=Reichenbachiella versicolor TaxID=1821036 RepID=UPI0013A5BA5F|nr:amidinotransferase [Reichenbachiella versicolor]
MNLNITDESSQLKAVILGLGMDMGNVPTLSETYDATSYQSVVNSDYPSEHTVSKELNTINSILDSYKIEVYRPENLSDTNQVYARDLGFVIGDTYFLPNIIEDRSHEQDALDKILNLISPKKTIRLSKESRVEGGDVIVWKDHVFIGYSKEPDFSKFKTSRTNNIALKEINNNINNYTLKKIELNKSDTNPNINTLHLDCCFQPIGENSCIIGPSGFKNKEDVDYIIDYFGKENCIFLNEEQTSSMNSNVFSISKNIIISDIRFYKLNKELEKRGFKVEKVDYSSISKMGGLFRCTTLPLIRE